MVTRSGRRRRSLQVGDGLEEETDHELQESNIGFSFNDVDNLIRKFSGQGSIKKWIEEFELYSITFKWNEIQKYIFCKRLLSGIAKLYVDCESKALNYRDLKASLYKEFQSRISAADVHEELRKNKKKKNESVREYLYKMVDIAAQVDVDEKSTISYIIDGIEDTIINKMVLYGAGSIEELKTKLLIYEKIKKDQSEVTVGNVKESYIKYNREKKFRCYGCGSVDHNIYNCPTRVKGPKCFKCNQYGHKRIDCQRKENEERNKVKSVNVIKNSGAHYSVKINGINLDALIDTGSEISIVKSSLIDTIKPNFFLKYSIIPIIGLGATIKTKGSCRINIQIDLIQFDNVELHVVDDIYMKSDIIIGMDILCQADVTMSNGSIKITKPVNLEIKGEENPKRDEVSTCYLAQIDTDLEMSNNGVDLSHLLNKKIVDELTEIISEYRPEKSTESPIQMKIIPLDDIPVFQSPRRFPPKEQNIIDEQVDEWLKNSIVVESASDYASPVVLVKKKDDTHRLCVDYRKLNAKIHRDHYPLPIIEDQIDKLQDAKVFTTLDLENGFFHVSIEPKSRRFTAFVTQRGQFEFLRVPFGLCNSPSIFQRYINFIFKDLIKEGIVIVYIDDIIIPAKSVEDGINKVKIVLRVAANNGLRIKWKKCQFLKEEVEYLGQVIKSGTVSPSVHKTKAVVNIPCTTTTKQIQSFLGLTGYFRKFILNYAIIARPLSDLLKKGRKFEFKEQQLVAFENLKNVLVNKPILKIFKYGAYTELHTDASKEGYGGILLQRSSEDAALHPVYYISRKTSDTEKKYDSYELEVLAVIQAVKKFRIYLLGQKFKLITDCKAFSCTMKKKDLTTRIARWALLLEEFDYEIEHRSGTRMRHVDALSRNPIVMSITQNNDFLRKLVEAQEQDEKLKLIKDIVLEKPYNNYFIYNEILCKLVNNNTLFVVPERMKTTIIKEIHEKGHFHHRKMKDIIMKEFFISDLDKRISKCISNCVRCILAERKVGKREGLLNPIPKGERPLDTLHVDHLGPLQGTKKSYKYIFAVIDSFTKFSWLFPTKTMSAEEVIQKMEVLAETFGYPHRLVADRGGAFTSKVFKDFCKDRDIKLVFITAGIPRGNGQIERLHSIVITTLTKMSLNDQEKWYSYIKSLQQILNSTYQRAINTSPFNLLIGVEMKTKKDITIMKIIEEESVKHFSDMRDELRQQAKKDIAKIQEENQRYYNKKRKKARVYNVGEKVAIERVQFGTAMKIRPKFFGPYKITASKGFDRYEVQKEGEHEGPNRTSTSVDRMKPWSEDDYGIEEDEVSSETED